MISFYSRRRIWVRFPFLHPSSLHKPTIPTPTTPIPTLQLTQSPHSTLPLLHGLPRRQLPQTTPTRRLRPWSHQELHDLAMGPVHKFQVRAHGAQSPGRQRRVAGLELLSQLPQLRWRNEAKLTAWEDEGGGRIAAFVNVAWGA